MPAGTVTPYVCDPHCALNVPPGATPGGTVTATTLVCSPSAAARSAAA